MTNTYQRLDVVVLEPDLAQHGLLRGDLGAVIELYEHDGVEVEFVAASGWAVGVLTLRRSDVRPVAVLDLLAVRRVPKSA